MYETYVLRSPPQVVPFSYCNFYLHVFPGFPIGQWQKSITFCIIEVTLIPGVSRRIPRKLPYQDIHGHTFSILLFAIYQNPKTWVRATCSRGVENSTAIGPSSKPAGRVTYFKQMCFLKVSENVNHRRHAS